MRVGLFFLGRMMVGAVVGLIRTMRQDIDRINEVQGATGRTGTTATEMTQSVARLTHDAEHLTQRISTFLSRVRAA